jgi:hypothetical protein
MPAPFNADFDRSINELGPVGENSPNLIKKGMCPIDANLFTSDEVRLLALCALDTFNATVKA